MENGRTVLVIDDDAEIVRGTILRLRTAGYGTKAAYNACDGLRSMQLARPDAILLDVRMPGLDGLGVLKRLQESRELRTVPVVMLSASLGDQRQALRAGARFFLAKPYRGSELLQVVRQVTARPTPNETAEPQPVGPEN